MFINCPYCKALVATDPATDLPPEHCPRCAARLRGVPMDAATPTAASTVPQEGGHAAPAPVFDLLAVPAPEAPADAEAPAPAATELSARIHQAVAAAPAPDAIAPIAALLRPSVPAPTRQPESGPAPEPVAAPARPLVAATPVRAPGPGPAPAAPAATTPPTPDDLDHTATGSPADAEAAAAPIPAEDGAQPAPGAGIPESPAPSGAAPAGPRAAEEVDAAPAPVVAQPPARALPSFARGRRLQASGLDWKTGATIVGLALLLLLQLLLADRARLAGDARWRPLLANVCGVLGCSLPPWREPEAFTVLARDVRPDPSAPGTLRVSATFRNDARWTQPWPRIRLTLSDINGNAVAARDFSARDYLDEAPTQPGLRSGQSASIAMHVVEPAARSVAFDFELH